MVLCSVVPFVVTVTVSLAQVVAAAFKICSASKSFDRMRTEPLVMPHSAKTGPPTASAATERTTL